MSNSTPALANFPDRSPSAFAGLFRTNRNPGNRRWFVQSWFHVYDDGSISDSRLRLPMSCSHSIQQLIQDICPLTLAYTTPLIITKTLQNEILLYIGSNALHHTRLKASAAMQIVPVNSNSRSLL